jgi:cell division protein FtsB
MNDTYLRKKKPGIRFLQRSIPRLLRRRGLWKVGFVSIMLAFILFGNRGVIQRVQLERDKQTMIERVKQAEQETELLREQLKKVYGDDQFIEHIARERYGMIRSGETVYRIAEE